MDGRDTERQRLAIAREIIASPPVVHPGAPNGKVWNTEQSCYELMAGHVRPGSRTLETGAGVSTALFAAWGCDHTAVVPFADEATAIAAYCHEAGIDTSTLRFDLRPSERALPELIGSSPLDLVFIDGAHGFPMPIIDWFYGAGLLRRGGVVVFDDVQLPAVSTFLNTYVELDDRWERIGGTPKWRAYRRLSEGTLSEHESRQPFFKVPPPQGLARASRLVKDAVPLRLRQWLASHVRDGATPGPG